MDEQVQSNFYNAVCTRFLCFTALIPKRTQPRGGGLVLMVAGMCRRGRRTAF
jgi:hypothetical protein